MFKKLITLLNDGNTYSLYDLSEELGVSIETLQRFIEYLSEKGFLTPVKFQKGIDGDADKCSNCTGCLGCSGKNFRGNCKVLAQSFHEKSGGKL
ncbi:MAG: HTH domain-containing protein [Fermentimonas sp.]